MPGLKLAPINALRIDPGRDDSDIDTYDDVIWADDRESWKASRHSSFVDSDLGQGK